MKNAPAFLLLSLFLFGCSKEAERRANIQPSPSVPFQITVVDTPESDEQKDIQAQTRELFNNLQFDKLDELAAKFRASKECYADGMWKLAFFYDAIDSPEQSSDSAWEAREAQLQAWVEARPESVTARVTLARFLRNYAWNARGSDYANTVSDKDWQLFGQRLNQALEVLNDAKTLKETCPVYWSTLLGVDLGLQVSKDQFNSDFIQAVQSEPDYMYYYRTRAVFLLPRWYGSAGEWQADLAKSADQIGGEKGDVVYAQVVWAIHYENEDVFDGDKISWDRVDRGFAAILKRFPDSLAAKNERAHLAALAGDKEKVQKYFLDTQGKVDLLSGWHAKGEFIDCANWAFAQ